MHPQASDNRFYLPAMLYARCVDRRDFTALDDIFTPDAVLAVVQGADNSVMFQFDGLDGIRKGLQVIEMYPRTLHMLGQQLVLSIDEQSASTETYCQATHYYETDAGPEVFIMYIRYCDEFRLVDGQWKISQRRVVTDITTGVPKS